MFYGIVTDKVDDNDEYTVKFIRLDDETYSGVEIWGFIYQFFKKRKITLDSSESIDVFLKGFMKYTN